MRGTLSHSFGRAARAGSSAIRIGRSSVFARFDGLFVVSVVALLATFVLATGCNRIDSEGDGASSQAGSATPWPPADYVWPTDPEHPVLRIDVDGIAGEGTIWIELMPELAPNAVAQVIELAGEGYYDATTFHRVIPDFMIQGGDPNTRDSNPTNDGQGPSARELPDEFGATPFVRGVVGLGNSGHKGSNSTQFFIMHKGNASLDGRYIAIGRVVRGLSLVDEIAAVETDRSGRWGPKDRPIQSVMLETVRIDGIVQALNDPAAETLAGAPESKTEFAKRAIEKAHGAAAAVEQAAQDRLDRIDGPGPAAPAAP